jgi:hypothetical protein
MNSNGDFKDKHLWVKKATGLGVTEFMLRLMAWLCTHKQTNHSGSNGNSQMCIVTGPNIEIATKLIKRLKGIFDTKLGLTFNDKETHLQLNGSSIEAYPSYIQKAIGIDPGFGSSPFGIVIVQFSDGVIEVLYSDEFERPRYEELINKVADLYNSFTNIKNICVDASSPELISSLKREV